jgi:tetratricopeptide (TPR) repeat protein
MNFTIKSRLFLSICILISTPICMAREDVWTEVKSPHFIVISDASPKQARRTARSFEQFRLVMQKFLPSGNKVDPGFPLIVFATQDSKGLRDLLPTDRLAKNAAQISGIFMGNSERYFVAVRLDLPEDQAYHTVYHEYVHMVMRLNYRKLPLWLNEGLAEMFAFAKLTEGKSGVGYPGPELLQQLQTNPPLPLSDLLAVTPDSPYYTEAHRANIFYAQSWALTHYLMFGDKMSHANQLNEFLKLLQRNIPEAEAASRAFGDLKALEQNLGRYIRDLGFYHVEFPAELTVQEKDYTARTLAQSESLALRGQCLVMANRLDDAKAMLEQALQLDSRSADANEGMGLLSLRLGNRDQAQNYFTAAAQLDSKSYLAQFYAGQAEYQKGENYRAAEDYLRKALAMDPDFVAAYSMLAHILLMENTRLPEALELEAKAANLEPAELRHRLNVCQILISMGRYDEASRYAKEVAEVADSEQDKNMAESILSDIKIRQDRIIGAQKRDEALRQRQKEIEVSSQKEAGAEKKIQDLPTSGQTNAPTAPIKRGPVGRATGVIKSVKCDYPAIMDIVLESGGKLQKFRAENYYRVQFESIGGPGKTGFEPCEELEGKTVQLEFQSVSGQDFSGFIQRCGIMR